MKLLHELLNCLNGNADLLEDTPIGIITEAEYQGKTVELNKPFRTPGGSRKFSVYVKNDAGKVIKVNFGDPNSTIKNDDPVRAKSFQARHRCSEQTDKTTAAYWSCNVARYAKSLGLKSSRPW
jgi:hypothetical protein